MQNSPFDELIRQVGIVNNNNQNRRAKEIEASKNRSFTKGMKEFDAKQRKKELFTADSMNTLRDERNKKYTFSLDSLSKEHEKAMRTIDRKYEAKKDSQNLIQTLKLMDIQSKKDSIRHSNQMQKEKERRLDDIEIEKRGLREKYIAPNLRGKYSEFFNEDDTFGLNESDIIKGYNKGQDGLLTAVANIKALGIPKSSPQRQKIENLALDMWKHINGDDMGDDFLDGGGFLGYFGDNTEQQQAQGIYDELESILMELGIPQEEWQNRIWVK